MEIKLHKNSFPQFANYVASNVWAILPAKLEEAIARVKAACLNPEESAKSLKEYFAKKNGENQSLDSYGYSIQDGTAIIDVNGIIEKKFDFWSYMFDGVSTEFIQKDIENALADPAVDRILLNINSPGGTVPGTKELSDFIFANKDVKPIYTYADSLMASAAYWIGSAAKAINTFETAYVGSIGVYVMHVDVSKALDELGFKVTFIQAGSQKTVGNGFQPLTDADKAVIQDRVDKVYDTFVADIARNRGQSAEYVRKEMADGKIFNGKDALLVNLIDGLSTLETYTQTLNEKENPMKMTLEQVQKDSPEVYNAILEAGKAAAKAEADKAAEALKAENETKISAAKQEGITSERARSKEIYDLASDSQKALAYQLIADGKTVEEAKTALLKDAQMTKATALEAFGKTAPVPAKDGASDPVRQSEFAAILKKFDEDKNFAALYENKGGKSALESALVKWEKDEHERADFSDVFTFLAYERNPKPKSKKGA